MQSDFSNTSPLHPQKQFLRARKGSNPENHRSSLGGFDFQQTGIKWSPEIWERTLGH